MGHNFHFCKYMAYPADFKIFLAFFSFFFAIISISTPTPISDFRFQFKFIAILSPKKH